MSLSAALEESYASGDEEGFVITAVELDHPGFEGPVYIVRSIDAPNGDEAGVVMLPVEAGGTKIAHTLVGFDFIRPGADQDGPTDGRVRIDNVSGLLYQHLKDAIGYGDPILVTFRQYRALPGQFAAITGPDEEIPGLHLQSVELTADAAEGTIAWPDGRKLNVPTGPNAIFNRDDYPALFS